VEAMGLDGEEALLHGGRLKEEGHMVVMTGLG